MKFTLKTPVSVNSLYADVNGRRVKTKAAKDWQNEAMQEILIQRIKQKKIPKPESVYVIFHRPDKRRFDSGNFSKILLDTFVKMGVLDDDSQLMFEQYQKVYDRKNYCEIEFV